MEKLSSQFSMVQSALSYLDTSGGLQDVKTTCLKYSKGEELLVYHFKLLIDPAEVSELNAALGNLLIVKPLKASDIFQEVVFQTVHELELLPSDTTLSQIAVGFQLACLPNPLSSCIINSVKDLSRSVGRTVYVKFNGIVTGVTGTSKYTQSTKYVCRLNECAGNQGNRFIRVHVAGASEKQTIRNDFICNVCGSVLEEDKSSRIISDKLLAEVVPESCFQDSLNSSTRQRIQAVLVCVRDELCELIQIGQKYHIIGMVKKDTVGETVSLALEANNILKIPCSVYPCLMSSLPETIVCLHEDRRDSPWSFSLSLAYVFGGEITPLGSYLKLKLGLLLSVAAASLERPLHILAMGSEVEIIRRLMNYCQQFCERSMCHMLGSHVTGKVISDRHETAPYFLEGGSLLLAGGGVCCMGDLSRLRKKDTEQLQAVLGSNKVFLDLGSKHTGGLPQQIVHPLRCQIWAYSDNKLLKNTKTSVDSFATPEAGNIGKKLLDAFGCVYFVDADDSITREEMDTQTAYQILMQAMGSEQGEHRLPVTAQEFKQLFEYMSRQRTKMTSEAQKLLCMYYLASRKTRSDSDTSRGVPVTALQTLESLAHGHAKLSLRVEVLEEDAVMAIKIYEENMTSQLGVSVLNVQPTSHVLSHCFGDFIGPENDKAMQQFHVQLIRFCGTAANLEE